MKPTPAHHKTVRVPFATVADGYGGARTFHGLDGLWQIVSATTVGKIAPHPEPTGLIYLVVAPARVAP